MSKFKIGDFVKMAPDAVERYGAVYQEVVFTVDRVATKHMRHDQYYEQGEPADYHPGYDTEAANGQGLYELSVVIEGRQVPFLYALYEWELCLAMEKQDAA